MPPETNVVECSLCGIEGTTQEMGPAATAAVGHHCDFGMACKWYCPPCFMRLFPRGIKHTDWEKGMRLNVYAWQDKYVRELRTSVWECCDEDLCDMENLPEGLKVNSADRARLPVLRQNLDSVSLLRKALRKLSKKDFDEIVTGITVAVIEVGGNHEFLTDTAAKIDAATQVETKEELVEKLRDAFVAVAQLQDTEDNALLHKICRNINKNSFYHPKTGMIKSYNDLVRDFRALETLTPEERNR